ncbi:MAG: hypothetical protein ACLSHU_02425 [Oscillospiraceae bacterium]
MMYYLDEYTQSHQTAGKGRMSNEQCSKTFASLRQEDMQLFFREWMKHKKQTEYVAYDVTSISSYSQNIREVEWGYNRDKERLPKSTWECTTEKNPAFRCTTGCIRGAYRTRRT